MARMIEVLQAISYVAVDAGVCRTRLRKLNVVDDMFFVILYLQMTNCWTCALQITKAKVTE